MLNRSVTNVLKALAGKLDIKRHLPIGEFRPQTDQRSDDSNLQHVKGETGRNRYKAVWHHRSYIIHFQHFTQPSL